MPTAPHTPESAAARQTTQTAATWLHEKLPFRSAPHPPRRAARMRCPTRNVLQPISWLHHYQRNTIGLCGELTLDTIAQADSKRLVPRSGRQDQPERRGPARRSGVRAPRANRRRCNGERPLSSHLYLCLESRSVARQERRERACLRSFSSHQC